MKEALKAPIIFMIVIALTSNCFGQELKNDRNISIGLYGIGYPTRFSTNIDAGGLFDISLKDKQRVCFSSSVNYTGFYFYASQFHNVSLTSGLSWKFQKNHICFRPGVQLGYLYQNRVNQSEFIFNGLFLRSSFELTYALNRFEYGLHFNTGVGIGLANYVDSYPESLSVQKKLGLMGGLGLQIKYNLVK